MNEPLTDQDWEKLLRDGHIIKRIVYHNGGMATKTMCENVLMKRHGLDRGWMHTVMNSLESRNDPMGERPAPEIMAEWRQYFIGEDCHWFRGNPFELEDSQNENN